MSPTENAAFGRAFMDMDLDDLDNFDVIVHTSLGELFPVASKINEPIVYIKDSAYEFSVDPGIIKKVEDKKFYGREDEYPGDHIIFVHDIANVVGKDEVQKHYYFLKLFPFSLGGEAKTWYNSLLPKSITSRESCVQLFYSKYLPADKVPAMKINISKFLKERENQYLKLGGDLVG